MKLHILDRVKLPFRKDKELYSSLYRILGFYPHNIEVYKTALDHKSSAFKTKLGNSVNNERLEFLGDAILGACVSDILYTRFPNKHEGFLTSTRSKLVQRETLGQLAAEMGLDRLIRHSTNNKAHHSYMGGNAFEALIGAIYIDRGYERCKWFLTKRILGKLVDIDGMAKTETNFKSKLLEWCQKNHLKLEFRIRDQHTPPGAEMEFDTVVLIEGCEAGFGKGFSKKESHQNAAREALNRIRKEQSFVSKLLKVKSNREKLSETTQASSSDSPKTGEKTERKPSDVSTPLRSAQHDKKEPAQRDKSESAQQNKKEPAQRDKSESAQQNKKEPAQRDKSESAQQEKRRSSRSRAKSKAEGSATESSTPIAENSEPSEEPKAKKPRRRPARRRPAKADGEVQANDEAKAETSKEE